MSASYGTAQVLRAIQGLRRQMPSSSQWAIDFDASRGGIVTVNFTANFRGVADVAELEARVREVAPDDATIDLSSSQDGEGKSKGTIIVRIKGSFDTRALIDGLT